MHTVGESGGPWLCGGLSAVPGETGKWPGNVFKYLGYYTCK